MKLYRARAVLVEAMQVNEENADHFAKWCGGTVVQEFDTEDPSKTVVGVNLPTLDGVIRVSEPDYVVRDVDGQFKKMAAAEFEEAFDRVGLR